MTSVHPDGASTPANLLLYGPASIAPPPAQIPGWSRERLARLPYQRHAKDGFSYPAIKLGRRHVAQCHFEEVWALFWQNVCHLDPARKHTTKAMCNDPAWCDRPGGQRIALGRCISYFATHGVLPITLANPGKSGPRKYFLNADLDTAPLIH